LSDITPLDAIFSQLNAARQSCQRRLVVLAGEPQWGGEIIATLVQQSGLQQTLWVTEQLAPALNCITRKQARQWLGRELDLLVYDAYAGFDPDALAAVSGALCGGGLLILLVPPLAQWRSYADPDYSAILAHPFLSVDISGRFVQHIIDSLSLAQAILLLEQGAPVNFQPVVTSAEPLLKRDDECLTDEQAAAVAAVIHVVDGHRRRPLVIRSDRGRGKSAALGIASAKLMQRDNIHIAVTAPRSASVATVFEHAARVLAVEPAAGTAPTSMTVLYSGSGSSSLQFVAPDELLRTPLNVDLLLVDEAAAIPASLLEQFLSHYKRIVFATTVQGYEGTGRGFDVRFTQTLQRLRPQWQQLNLQQPIRWAAGDPVEHWLFEALLLNASAADDIDAATVAARQCVIERLDRDALLADKHTLRALFGLLVLAHYQTTPADLRLLLDGPNISVWVSRFQGKVVAAALVAAEGGFDDSLAMAVWRGERRPRGHLLPQTLSSQCGLQQAAQLRYQRVMRIAVHPLVQRMGLGQQLMTVIMQQARVDNNDFVGSSFAATADVLTFWRQQGFEPVRLGLSRDASSGCHSALVLAPLTNRAELLFDLARQRFNQHFSRELALHFQFLEPELVAVLLLNNNAAKQHQLDQQDHLDIEAFSRAYRQLEQSLLPLWRLVCIGFSSLVLQQHLSAAQQQLLIQLILQNRPIKQVADSMGLSGKRQVLTELRKLVTTIIQAKEELE